MDGPLLLVAEFADEAEALVASLKSIFAVGPIRAIALQPQAAEPFSRAGLPVDDTVPWLTSEAHARVAAACMELAARWYPPLEAHWPEAFRPGGWSFGEDAEHVVSLTFTHFGLVIELMKHAIETLRPKEVRVATGRGGIVTDLLLQSDERYLAPIARRVCDRAQVAYREVSITARPMSPRGRSRAGSIRATVDRLMNRDVIAGLLARFVGAEVWWHRTLIRRFARQPIRIVYWEGVRGGDPVVKELRARKAGIVALTATRRGLRVLDQGIVRVSCAESGSAATYSTLDVEEALATIPSLAYGDVELRDLFIPRAAYLLRTHYPECLQVLAGAARFVEEFRPHLLITRGHLAPHMQWALQAFHRAGVATVLIPHGYQVVAEQPSVVVRAYGTMLKLRARYLCAPGELYRRFYATQGVSAERVFVTGAYDWDIGARDDDRRAASLRRLGLSPNRFTVLYANSGSSRGRERAYAEETHDEIVQSARDLMEAIGSAPDLQLVVRLHPGMPTRVPFDEVATRYSNVAVTTDGTFADALTASDTVVTFCSTAGVQGLASDRPVVIYNRRGRLNNYTALLLDKDGTGSGFVLLADTPDELVPLFRRIRDDAAFRDRLADSRREVDPLLHRTQHGAAQRIADVLVSLAQTPQNADLRLT